MKKILTIKEEYEDKIKAIPTEITNENPLTEYNDFEDHIWFEITKIAAQMYIENQSDPRYKTITNEVLTQE